jgi:hypothetical protein
MFQERRSIAVFGIAWFRICLQRARSVWKSRAQYQHPPIAVQDTLLVSSPKANSNIRPCASVSQAARKQPASSSSRTRRSASAAFGSFLWQRIGWISDDQLPFNGLFQRLAQGRMSVLDNSGAQAMFSLHAGIKLPASECTSQKALLNFGVNCGGFGLTRQPTVFRPLLLELSVSHP